jgi:hypothetical protein
MREKCFDEMRTDEAAATGYKHAATGPEIASGPDVV